MQLQTSQSDKGRDRILSAAAILFCEHGYAGVSMRKIADSCEMKAGSLYYHFKSKDQILTEVLNIGIKKVHAAVATALADTPKDTPAIGKLRRAISGHLHALLEYSSFTSANVRIFRQVPTDIQLSNLDVRRAYEALWYGFLNELTPAGYLRDDVDPRSLRLMLIGALNATLEWYDPKVRNIAYLADHYTDMLANGMLAERNI